MRAHRWLPLSPLDMMDPSSPPYFIVRFYGVLSLIARSPYPHAHNSDLLLLHLAHNSAKTHTSTHDVIAGSHPDFRKNRLETFTMMTRTKQNKENVET